MSRTKTPAKSLSQPDRTGWMTKLGGKFPTWKRRWFVLKGNRLYYFKGQNDADITGVIDLTNKSSVKREDIKGKQHVFSISTTNRVYFMYPDNPNDQEQWINDIQKTVQKLSGSSVNIVEPAKSSTGTSKITNDSKNYPPAGANTTSVRDKLNSARRVVSFLAAEDSKVLEFWQIWQESLPPLPDIEGIVVYEVSVSLDLQKLTWRTSGPQHTFIQRMVDFFWNVGAPESEIDRLNDVGALINPTAIGSWIDMSGKGGMDGGWFFPVDVPIKFAIEAADAGDPITRVDKWAKQHNIERCTVVGRDMGAAPPRQTEIRFDIPGSTFNEQYEIALSAWKEFEFPALPPLALEIITSMKQSGLTMSVVTSSEGFVKLGIYVPLPTREVIEKCLTLREVPSMDKLLKFEQSLSNPGPDFVEFHYLRSGYGYGVYTEGFDIALHYKVGDEGPDVWQ